MDQVNEDSATAESQKERSILKHFIAEEQSEGDGATVRRSVGSYQMTRFSPFLMLDDFKVTPPEGFPDHPHHGQETITYVTGGILAHEDFTGSKGVLYPGDLQFMTAGKGIVHCEMPVTMNDSAVSTGLQFWVDLPADLKNCEPRYRNLRADTIPVVQVNDNLNVKVISGKSYDVESVKDLAYTPIDFYYFISNKAGTEFAQEIPPDFNAFIYVTKGAITIGEEVFKVHSSVFFQTDGNFIRGFTASDNTEFAVIGGKILDQQVVQHGPFAVSYTHLDVYKRQQYLNYNL